MKTNEFNIKMGRGAFIYFTAKLGGVPILQGLPQGVGRAGCGKDDCARSELKQFPGYAEEWLRMQLHPAAVAAVSGDPSGSGRCA